MKYIGSARASGIRAFDEPICDVNRNKAKKRLYSAGFAVNF